MTEIGDPTCMEAWIYRLCDPATCAHWHHQVEVAFA